MIGPKSSHPKSESSSTTGCEREPLIGICLKRYDIDPKTHLPRKKNTLIDIPLDIRMPHFVDDDEGQDGPPEYFKLSLQSIICHRGVSTMSGHYVSYIRGTSPIVDGDSRSKRKLSNANCPPGYSKDRWIRSDDLAKPRIDTINIEEALKNDTPYLLFYQALSYEVPSPPDSEPPSYNESTIEVNIDAGTPLLERNPVSLDGATDEPPPSFQMSRDSSRPGTPRRSINLPEDRSEFRRGSLAFTENSMASTASSILDVAGASAPVEETTAQRMSRVAQKLTTRLPSKSRPPSQSGEKSTENRFSATFSRLNLKKSKDPLHKPDTPRESTGSGDAVVIPEAIKTASIEEPVIDTTEHLSEVDPNIDRSMTKKEKKRSKSQAPGEKADSHHHHLLKDKGKGKAEHDRECTIM